MHYFLALLLLFSSTTFAAPTLDDYVLDATISDMELSPNGKLIAFTKRVGDKKALIMLEMPGEVVSVFDAGEDKLRGYEFADDDHLIMYKSVTTRFPGYTGEYEYHGAISVNFRSKKSKQLLSSHRKVLYPQLHLNQVLGPAGKKGHVLMAARSGKTYMGSTYDIYRVNLDTGRAKRIHKGKHHTKDWFVDDKEIAHAREDYDNKRDLHRILVKKGKKWEPIFSNKTEIREQSFVGMSSDNKHLVVLDEDPTGEFDALYHISLADGSMSKPIMHRPGKEIDAFIRGWNSQIIGVRYSGYTPSYEFYDKDITRDIEAVTASLPNSAVNILEFSRDLTRVLLLVEGGESSGDYLLLDRKANKVTHLASKRPEIPDEYYSKTQLMNIPARDGLVIPTLVTLPSKVKTHKNLPAIMLPHGGPENYDRLGYDYQAQYFASEGNVVIQPNFRGSTGFGYVHRNRGRGRWGKEMQTDVSDVLAHLVNKGIVDSEKVCIVGSSYGGYSALAGGAFTSELYRCIVAVAPVTDLPKMLKDDESDYGKDHWAVAYWKRVVGDRKEEREKLKDVSPAYHAKKFTAPVLLLHGDDDTVVPFAQSKLMYKRLKKAGKQVKLVKLKNEDHWMSNEKTRLQAMKEISKFVKKHLN